MNAGRPKTQAFTLIELLVVVAIIAVLVAILLPALAAARGQAKTVACTSNLRQQGMAVAQYCDLHNGTYPAAIYGPAYGWPDDGYGYKNSIWTYQLMKAGVAGYRQDTLDSVGVKVPEMIMPGIGMLPQGMWRCPEGISMLFDQMATLTDGYSVPRSTHYGMNALGFQVRRDITEPTWQSFRMQGNLMQPAMLPMITDTANTDATGAAMGNSDITWCNTADLSEAWVNYHHLAYPHLKRTGVLWADGHASSAAIGELTSQDFDLRVRNLN
jgi:prepilin-type N-terminal cleavage/methylation domain-containing protein/prepilin-type processing-associated H-X9-DG protein